MKTHNCLVSAQATANHLPALDTALKPEKIVLIVSPKMQISGQRPHGKWRQPFSLSNEHDYRTTEDELLGLATTLDQDEVSLNITGTPN